MRFNAPIFAYEHVVEKAGIHLDIIQEEEELLNDAIDDLENDDEIHFLNEEEFGSDFSGWSKEELEEEMKKAVMNEDYELAARLRDEIENLRN